jgi:hypothetical protein
MNSHAAAGLIAAAGVFAMCTHVAHAQPPSDGIQLFGPLEVTPGGTFSAGNGWSQRTSELITVYDNTHVNHYQTGDPADYTFAATVSSAGDSLTLELPRVGPSQYGPRFQYLDRMEFSLSHLDRLPSGVMVDVYHLFYDDLVTWTGTGDCTPRVLLGGFYLSDIFLPPCDPGTCVTSFTVTDLWQLGIVLDDNALTYVQTISFPNSGGTPNEDPDALMVFAGDGTASGVDGKAAVGESTDQLFVVGNCFYGFGGTPNVSNIRLKLDVIYCDSDFDGSGFSDFDDFSAFVNAFEAGC